LKHQRKASSMFLAKSHCSIVLAAFLAGCGENGSNGEAVSFERAEADVLLLVTGEYVSLGGEYLAPLLERIEKNAKLYNQVIHRKFLGPRFHVKYPNSIPSALQHLARWDPKGSLANANAYRKHINDSLAVYEMVLDKLKLSEMLKAQDINDLSALNRLLDLRKQIDGLIASLEKAGTKSN